ncbi:MAG: hypothetical protein GF341_13525 [candidate division Zixibacteria bacterium]|nr:hypothetical protein [candidate division Zixibacteria bacterium]
MAAVNLKRAVSIVVLAILVLAFVVMPGSQGLVMADGVGGGHPVEPPDSTQDCIQPNPEVDPVYETSLLVSGLSMMLL